MSWKFTLSLLFTLSLGLVQLGAQTCGDLFYDSGGPDGDYSNEEFQTWTICPDNPGDLVTLNFIFVDVEGCCDDLAVFNGSDQTDPLNLDIENPESFTSSAMDGCLTVTWSSDFSVTNGGWEASVSCAPPPPCPNPTVPVVGNVTSSGATFSWNQTGDVTLWDLEIIEVGTGATGTPTISGTSDNPFTWTEGASGTAYELYLRGQCAEGGEFTNWVGPVFFTTVPGCGDGFYDSGGPDGDYQNVELQTWVFCPDNPGDLVTLNFTFVDVEGCCDDLMIFSGSGTALVIEPDLEAPASFTSTASDGCLTVTWDSDFSVTNGGWAADITCEPAPPCADPSGLAVTGITTVSAVLSWQQIGLVNTWDIEVVPAGTPPTGTPTITDVTDNPYALSGLDSGTEYEFYVRGQCEGDEPFTAWIGPVAFTTFPGCGDTFYDSGGPEGDYQTNEFQTYIFCPDNPGDLVTLDFTFVDVESCCDDLAVFSGADAAILLEVDLETPASFTSLSADGCLTVTWDSDFTGTFGGWAADVSCAAPPACGDPLFLTVTGVTSNSAMLGWSQIGPVSVWDIEVVPAGEAPTGVPTVTDITDNPYMLTGLESGTDYEFYVRGQCDEEGPFTGWSGPAAFRTVPGCGDQFFDSGGPDGEYANNAFESYTFCPDEPGDVVIIEFSYVDVELCCDELAVYNGSGTTDVIDPDVEEPGIFFSTAADGCLTVTLDPDFSVTNDGWEATVTCAPCIPNPVILSGDVNIEFFGATTAEIGISLPDATDYTIEYGGVGFEPGTGTMVSGSGELITLEDLAEGTDYEFYLINLCEDGTESIRVGPFFFSTIFSNDVGITGLLSPEGSCGLGLGEEIRVAITNFGADPQSLFPLNFSVNGEPSGVGQPQDGFFTGIISRDSTEEFVFDLLYDFDEPGEYTIQLWTEMQTDSDLSNDTITFVITNFAPPLYEDFEAGLPPYIGLGGNAFLAPAFAHNNNTQLVAANLFGGDDELLIDLPVLGPMEETDTLFFDYRYVNWSAGTDPTTNLTGTDILSVLVSLDCGETFGIAFIQAGTDHEPNVDLRTVAVPLGLYAGENILIRISGSYGSGASFADYWLDIDNINLPRCGDFTADAEITNVTPGMDDGQIIVVPTGGIGPFEFLWDTGDVTDTLSNLAPGNYAVTITDRGGCSVEITYLVDFVDNLDDPTAVIGELKLAPNPTPAQATLRADFAEAVDARIEVVNTLGQAVWRSQVYRNVSRLNEQIDLSQVPAGVYFVRVQAAGQTKTVRLVKAQ